MTYTYSGNIWIGKKRIMLRREQGLAIAMHHASVENQIIDRSQWLKE